MEIQEKNVDRQQKIILIVVSSFSVISVVAVSFLAWYIFDARSSWSLVKENLENGGATEQNSPNNSEESNLFEFNDNEELSTEEVIKRVSKHMLLSEGDITVATVTNLKGLRDDFPDLFQYAKSGDRLIFYSLGIIIYDPVLDKVVDVLRRFENDVVIPRTPEEKI